MPAQTCVVTIRKRSDPVRFTVDTFQGVVATEFRIGSGHDSHRLGQGNPMCLGGVAIERASEVVAHSDGDVLLHALTDALLGAMAWGDIGEWFPDTDPRYQGCDSQEFVISVLEKIKQEGWTPVNVDSTVFLQSPKLSPYKKVIRKRLASLMDIPITSISFKAKTGEHVGPIGRSESIQASVVLLLKQTASSTHS